MTSTKQWFLGSYLLQFVTFLWHSSAEVTLKQWRRLVIEQLSHVHGGIGQNGLINVWVSSLHPITWQISLLCQECRSESRLNSTGLLIETPCIIKQVPLEKPSNSTTSFIPNMKSSVQVIISVSDREEIIIKSGKLFQKNNPSNVDAKRHTKVDTHFVFLCSCSFGPDFREQIRTIWKSQKDLYLETPLLIPWLADFANSKKNICIKTHFFFCLLEVSQLLLLIPQQQSSSSTKSFLLLCQEGTSCKCWQITRANSLHVTTAHTSKSASPGALKAFYKTSLNLPYRGQSKELKS